MGTHPLYLLGITAYRMLERPWILGGLCILTGYFQAALTRMPRYENLEFRSFLHKWQLAELKRRITRSKLPTHNFASVVQRASVANADNARLESVLDSVNEQLSQETAGV